MPSPADVHPWVARELSAVTQRLRQIELAVVGAGSLILRPANLSLNDELRANGAVVLREDHRALYSAIGTVFNTGGETPTQFRLPNIPSPSPGVEWRISLGN